MSEQPGTSAKPNEATPTSAINAPVAPQTSPIPAVGSVPEQERFLAVLAKVQGDAAKENLAARKESFEAEDTAEEEAPEEATEADASSEEEAPEAAPAASSSPAAPIAKIKALLTSDPAAAITEIENLLGKDALKALKLDNKQWAAFRHEKKQAREAFEAREQQLQGIHQQLSDFHSSLQPMIKAKEAFDAGDYLKAHELAFGLDVNEFQKRALKQKAGEDPRVLKMEREMQEMKAEKERQAQEAQAAQLAARRAAAQKRYLEDLVAEISSFEDPTLARAAALPGFVDQVLEIQRDNYDRYTDSSLPTVEAAEQALAKFKEAHERWNSVFQPVQSGTSENATDRAEPAKTVTKEASTKKPAKKSLTQSTATEAAGRGKALTPDEIYNKHLRLMERAAVEELSQQG